MKTLRMLIMMTFLTGIFYPLLVTIIAQAAFRWKANGSLIKCNGNLAGSELLAQKSEDGRYFQPRPSVSDFMTIPSGAGNKGPTSRALRDTVTERSGEIRAANNINVSVPLPPNMVYASGSGLDPHISPPAARIQIERIAAARSLRPDEVEKLVDRTVEQPTFGFLGETRVNVLRLNLALDRMDSTR